MPKKKNAQQEPAEDTVLITTAKSVGAVVGKIALAMGTAPERHPAARSAESGKLKKKNKSRLPRREKKAQNKASETSRKVGM